MESTTISVDAAGLERLHAAALECAKLELDRLTQAVIIDLKSRPANGAFGELAARHLWDEYCWEVQDGPFDDECEWEDVTFGSTSSAFEDLISTVALTEVEQIPRHLLIFLSVLAFDLEPDFSAEDPWSTLGNIWPEGVAKCVVDQVNEVASRRSLDLIGPYRADCLRSAASGSGVVWTLLEDRGEAWDIATEYMDDLVDPDSDLEPLADALLDAFIEAAMDDADHSKLSEFFEECGKGIRNLLRAEDVMANLCYMRAQVTEHLDG